MYINDNLYPSRKYELILIGLTSSTLLLIVTFISYIILTEFKNYNKAIAILNLIDIDQLKKDLNYTNTFINEIPYQNFSETYSRVAILVTSVCKLLDC